jgi:hypothetical protein
VSDEICHFDSDAFCLFEPFFTDLTQLDQLVSASAKKYFSRFFVTLTRSAASVTYIF